MVQDVLAVAGPELEAAQELDDLRRQPRDADLVDGLLARLADDEVDLGARLGDDLLDAAGVDPAVLDELRQREPGDLAADRVEARDDDRLRGVVDDQVDARRLLEGPDVPALAADDPALHLVGREMDHRHGVFGRVVGGDPLHRGDDDVARLLGCLVAGGALDRASDSDGVVLGFLANGFEQERLRLLGAHLADPLEGADLLLLGPRQLLARLVELPLALHELPVALLEHVGALVDLLVALEEPPLEGGEVCALAASLLLHLALEPELLVLRLEDQVLLLGPGSLDDERSLLLGVLDRLAGPDSPGEEADCHAKDEGHKGDPRPDHDIHHVPPVRPIAGRRSLVRSHDRVRGSRDGLDQSSPAPYRRPIGNSCHAPESR